MDNDLDQESLDWFEWKARFCQDLKRSGKTLPMRRDAGWVDAYGRVVAGAAPAKFFPIESEEDAANLDEKLQLCKAAHERGMTVMIPYVYEEGRFWQAFEPKLCRVINGALLDERGCFVECVAEGWGPIRDDLQSN